jgi:hypothetical protein
MAKGKGDESGYRYAPVGHVPKQRKVDIMKGQEEKTQLVSRRSILKGSALLLVGEIAGRISTANSAEVPTSTTAAPLPWKWAKLDPLEAGRRAYRFYLDKKG